MACSCCRCGSKNPGDRLKWPRRRCCLFRGWYCRTCRLAWGRRIRWPGCYYWFGSCTSRAVFCDGHDDGRAGGVNGGAQRVEAGEARDAPLDRGAADDEAVEQWPTFTRHRVHDDLHPTGLDCVDHVGMALVELLGHFEDRQAQVGADPLRGALGSDEVVAEGREASDQRQCLGLV